MTGILTLLLTWSCGPRWLVGAVPERAAVELDPKILTFRTPDQFKWRDPANKGPNNGVSLHRRRQDRPLCQLTKWNKGNNFSRPHFHANDRLIYVLSGTWWNGTGTAFDPPNTIPMRAGIVRHPSRQGHALGRRKGRRRRAADHRRRSRGEHARQGDRGHVQQLNPAAVTFLTPDQFKWRDPFHKSPTNQVILYGDPAKAGPYITINKFSPAPSAARTSIPTTASSWCSRAPGGSAPGRNSTPTIRCDADGHVRDPFRQGHPLRRREGRRSDGADHRHGAGDQHACRAEVIRPRFLRGRDAAKPRPCACA